MARRMSPLDDLGAPSTVFPGLGRAFLWFILVVALYCNGGLRLIGHAIFVLLPGAILLGLLLAWTWVTNRALKYLAN